MGTDGRGTPELFAGLPPAALHRVLAGAGRRSFQPGDVLCREGEPGGSVLVLQRGAAEVLVGEGGHRVRRLRRGDVVGEVALLTGEPRSATVRATAAGSAVELSRETLTRALAQHPQLLANLARILSRRLAGARPSAVPSGRGEAVGLVLTGSLDPAAVDAVLGGATAASPRPVAVLRVPAGGGPRPVQDVVARLDDELARHGTVVVVAPAETDDLLALLAELDRTVVLGAGTDTAAVEERLGTGSVEQLDPDARGPGWVGRQLTRTRLGLALGAGGARGYAHVGVVAALEEAGHVVDAVAGTDVGATVGACLASGLDGAATEEVLRRVLAPGPVAAPPPTSSSVPASPWGALEALMASVAVGRDVADLPVPFAAMAADLDTRLPVALTSGPLRDALLASNAVAGLFPPFLHAGRRLVDGVALAPVPVDAARALGADVVVSVNLLSRDVLPAWPGGASAATPDRSSSVLDTLLEVLDLTQLDASVRDAALADVVVTPRFGPGSARDHHLADRYLSAGREAAGAALEQLARHVSPGPPR